MSLQERITRALHDEADNIDVDVRRVHTSTRVRLAEAPLPGPAGRGRRTRVWAGLAVAAVVVAVVGSVVALRPLLPGGLLDPGPAGDSIRGGVSRTFTCPQTVTVDDAGRRTDDSFLPDVNGGPDAAAEMERAPRFEYDEAGDAARLWLGNRDGTLASLSTFARTGGRWDLVTTEKCAAADGGILVPEDRPERLGVRDDPPFGPKGMVDVRRGVLVDDRPYYDVAGLVHHRSMWVEPCGRRVCTASGQPSSMVLFKTRRDTAPLDASSAFLPPDDNEGRPDPWGLWLVNDAEGSVREVHASTRDGGRVTAQGFTGPGWTGRLYALVARYQDVDSIVVRTEEGSRTYPKQTVAGNEP
jgi:hypothetical protein